ncbi:hypothetical protein HYV44_03775 [Candidatus Microgenomates bacterium]|nr:hypothetical protein [Candidatus Microgenomates bacterium]
MIPFDANQFVNKKRTNFSLWQRFKSWPTHIQATVAAVFLLVAISFVASGFKIGTFADTIIETPVNYNFDYKGVSIHTKAESLSPGRAGTATTKSGDEVLFTLTINNAETSAKKTDVRFTLPPGFLYKAGTASNSNFIQSGQIFTWADYSAQSGDSTITLKAIVP